MPFFCLIVAVLLSACKKESVFSEEDKFIEHIEEFSELKPEVSAAGYEFIEIQWKPIQNTHYKPVTYTIYLNDKKIIESLTANKYSLINLSAGQKYEIKVVASTTEGKQTSNALSASTLSPSNAGLSVYQEYRIHQFSVIGGNTSVQKLPDGGHLLVKLLQHEGYFDDDPFKIVIFRTDVHGNMVWYKLLRQKVSNTTIGGVMPLALHNNGQEGLMFLQNYVIKFSIANGEIILEKAYGDDLSKPSFQSIYYASNQQVIIGTQQGSLMAINPEDLSLLWNRMNIDRPGAIGDIKIDSKRNIYYIFRDRNDSYANIRVHKCNPEGEFIKSFLFDGTLPGEYNYGFNMSALLIDNQDKLYLFGKNYSYNFLRFFKFDTEGNVIKKNQTSDYLLADQAFFNTNGDIVLLGQVDGGGFATYSGLYVFDKDMNIKSKLFYKDIPYHRVSGITSNIDGTYNLFLAYVQTYTYSNKNFIFIKTGLDGKI
ncbi:fibronectin type III domain-containing protein [Pedobacter rhizosphaerae]|nr:fibronectin type III domain-containing protein [Pedobacter rhizosphaerae]